MAAKPGKCCGFGVLAFFVLGCDIHWGVSQTWPRLGAIVRKSVSGLSIAFFTVQYEAESLPKVKRED